MDLLCIRANKAKYALNNIIKLKNLPGKVALRLFDAAVLPILTYGSEIWALNSTLDHEKWDRSSTKRVHLDFIRHILGVNRSVNNLLCRAEVGRFLLGVNRSVNNLLCRAEVGRFPINIEINYKILNFYKHIKDLPEHSIAHQTYIMDNEAKGLSKLYTCNQHIRNLKNITTSGILDLNKRSVKKILRSSYEIIWKEKIKTSTRGIYFSKFKQNIDYESYLDHINQRSIRRSLSKLRMSDHKLMIEEGRKIRPKLSQSERICQLCNDGLSGAVEDEIHFLFDCTWRKYHLHRKKFIEDVGKMVTSFNYLNTSQKFLYIVTGEDK